MENFLHLLGLRPHERLRAIRGSRLQQDFADELGIDRSHYNQLERGRRGIGPRIAEKLAAGTGLPVDFFLGPAEARPLDEISDKLDSVLGVLAPPALEPTDSTPEVLRALGELHAALGKALVTVGRLMQLYEDEVSLAPSPGGHTQRPPAEDPPRASATAAQ